MLLGAYLPPLDRDPNVDFIHIGMDGTRSCDNGATRFSCSGRTHAHGRIDALSRGPYVEGSSDREYRPSAAGRLRSSDSLTL
jgi:hypothetical protein